MHNRIFVGLLIVIATACTGDDSGKRNGASSSAGRGGSAGTSTFENPNVGGGSAPSGGTGGGVTLPDDGVCEIVRLTASPTAPDMLIVLDRSGSMGVEGRWEPSVAAVRSIVTNLQSQIRFGLAMFPDPDNAGGTSVQIDVAHCLNEPDPFACIGNALVDAGAVTVGNTGGDCAAGRIVVPVGLDTGAEIEMALSGTIPLGGTPTPETLQRLVDEFAVQPAGPDADVKVQYILLVTDGQPTCPNGGGSETTQPDIDASYAAMDALTAKGVKTYVIGYNTSGPGNEAVDAVLDGLAVRGGTGDTEHRAVEDEQGLLSQLQSIAGVAVSCTFALDAAPPRADHVRVTLDAKQVNLDDPNGWRMVGDRAIELVGSACTTFQSAGFHSVEAEVRCEAVGPE